MKKTALYDRHISLDAKMVPFAGYDMPVSYSGIIEEHHTVREQVGMFDVSHMGEFIIRGEGALDLIQRVTSNDASKLGKGDAQYSCFPNGKGGIVDDLLVYNLGEEEYMLVVNASNIQKDWDWLTIHNTAAVDMKNISDATSLMAVQGPNAIKALQSLTDIDLEGMKYYTFVRGTFAGVDNVIVSATGYTGSGGFEIYVANEDATRIWDAIMEAGGEYGLKPIGLGARDTLRLEMGYCLYGNDIDDTTSPLEAGLGWITKLKKDVDFVDKDFLIEQKATGVQRKLVGFEVLGKRPPRHAYPILDANGNEIGVVTSGTKGPSVNISIGMGYVAKEHSKKGSSIFIDARGKRMEAKIVGLPFHKLK
ncbi:MULTISPECIES: glycine cleavage system aminomethyltransferase GcvT [unclassified Aureispira]|uniref:glycine cleavage system aminomethyltransferase GcvT n=1 Tax=unclassified Aureispira TaxID=2649989 RepID=UPI0006969E19|nr:MULTISPECIES: glycine cleavage system aminomethyltransferase GcvT [unclassified Aureispira]WMX15545.1 glycine cleavage system aminomethyltransferase GcvT [Aureispira sp. CCB-E]